MRMARTSGKRLFDDLIGSGEQQRRDRQAQTLCSGQVDHQPKDGGLLDWEFGGRSPPQDSVDVAGSLPEQIVKIR